MGWCSRLAAWPRWAAVLASAAGIAVLSPGLAPPAAAAPRPASGGPARGAMGISGDFGLVPALGPQGQSTSYFQLAIAPGHAVTATVIVSNLSKHRQALALQRAVGVTASTGGSVYVPVTGRCSGPACWVTGLPGSAITLPGGGYTQPVTFTVRVPPRTPPGQYLSGITAVPATRPAPVSLGSNGGAGTQAVILPRVTVGVAVTVGDRSALVSRLSIHGVRGSALGQLARLNIGIYNTGRTFAYGKGQAACQAFGRRYTYTAYANTVLPGQHSLATVNAPGLPEHATVRCAIRIRYGKGQLLSWSGRVVIPAGSSQHYVSAGNGAFVAASPAGFSRQIELGVGVLAVGTVAVVVRKRRPRRRR